MTRLNTFTKRAIEAAEKFNAKYSVGIECSYNNKVYKTRAEAFEMCGSAVVFLEGVSGCVDIESCKIN